MKNILMFLLLASCIIFTSCQKEEEFDLIDIDTTTEEPTEEEPRIKFKAFDVDGNPLSDTKLSLYNEGDKAFEAFTDSNGEVVVTLPKSTTDKRSLLIGEKEVYNDNILRIEPSHLEEGVVEMVLSPESSSSLGGSPNVYSLLSSEVVLVEGQVLEANGDPGKAIVVIFEPDAVLNGDTSLFQNFTTVDAQGNFEMLVPVDVPLLISIFENSVCTGTEFRTINEEDVDLGDDFFGENIGPFSNDTTLPANTNASEGDYGGLDVNVLGTVQGCNGTPIANAKVLLGLVDFSGVIIVDTVWSDNNGQIDTQIDICPGGDLLSASVIVSGSPTFQFNAYYSQQSPTADFGVMDVCVENVLRFKDHTGEWLTDNDIEIDSYQPDVSLSIKESVGASDKFVMTLEKDTDDNWICTSFEYYENGELLYESYEDFVIFLKDDGVKIEMNIIGFNVEVLAGPDAGTLNALFGLSVVLYK